MKVVFCTKRSEQERFIDFYRSKTGFEFIDVVSIIGDLRRPSFFKIVFSILRTRKYLRRENVAAVVTFGEHDSEYCILLAAARSAGIRSISIQWAISFPKAAYIKLHRSQKKSKINDQLSFLGRVKSWLTRARYQCFGLDYYGSTYLGDGLADYLIAMGPFWSDKFKTEHPSLPRKFVDGCYVPIADIPASCEEKKYVLLILGAGVEIYNNQVGFKDWVHFLAQRGVSKADLLVRPHPKTNPNLINQISMAGFRISSDQLAEDLNACVCVCLERSSVLLDATYWNLPIVLFDSLSCEFVNYSKLGLREVELDDFPQLPTVVISERARLLGSTERAIQNFSELLNDRNRR